MPYGGASQPQIWQKWTRNKATPEVNTNEHFSALSEILPLEQSSRIFLFLSPHILRYPRYWLSMKKSTTSFQQDQGWGQGVSGYSPESQHKVDIPLVYNIGNHFVRFKLKTHAGLGVQNESWSPSLRYPTEKCDGSWIFCGYNCFKYSMARTRYKTSPCLSAEDQVPKTRKWALRVRSRPQKDLSSSPTCVELDSGRWCGTYFARYVMFLDHLLSTQVAPSSMCQGAG